LPENAAFHSFSITCRRPEREESSPSKQLYPSASDPAMDHDLRLDSVGCKQRMDSVPVLKENARSQASSCCLEKP
jgi:hypothetical protein